MLFCGRKELTFKNYQLTIKLYYYEKILHFYRINFCECVQCAYGTKQY